MNVCSPDQALQFPCTHCFAASPPSRAGNSAQDWGGTVLTFEQRRLFPIPVPLGLSSTPMKGGKLVALAMVAVLTLTAEDCGPGKVLDTGKRRCTKENRFDRGDDCRIR
jgi:hypothetical protein